VRERPATGGEIALGFLFSDTDLRRRRRSAPGFDLREIRSQPFDFAGRRRLGQRGETMHGWDLDSYADRARAFGCHAIEIDGHDVEAIDRAYAEAIQNKNASNQSLARHLQEARWLLRSIEQRFATIQRVADAIVARQRGFFDYGEVAMKPLTLKLIAGELGLHESTVCRVTNNKYMATPRGLFEFKHFFSRRLATDNGGAASATAVRAVMKELIAAEDPRAPLSDAELARLLAQQGLRVARRTITKYRALMRMPSVDVRRADARSA